MGEVKWIKVSTDMFNSNRKIRQIELMPEGDTILVIWLKLLLLAGTINDGGSIYLTPEIPYTDEMLAVELCRPITTVRMALSVFERFGMIEIIDNVLYLSSWEKYQNTDRLAEIRAKDRERKRLKKEQAKASLPEAQNSTEIPRKFHGASTGIPSIEEEGERDKEKESHSFIRACEGVNDVGEPVENSTDRESLKLKYIGGTLGGGVVMLSDEQFADLCDKLSYEELNKYIGIVRDCEQNGKPYKKKTHYQAILDMVQKDRRTK